MHLIYLEYWGNPLKLASLKQRRIILIKNMGIYSNEFARRVMERESLQAMNAQQQARLEREQAMQIAYNLEQQGVPQPSLDRQRDIYESARQLAVLALQKAVPFDRVITIAFKGVGPESILRHLWRIKNGGKALAHGWVLNHHNPAGGWGTYEYIPPRGSEDVLLDSGQFLQFDPGTNLSPSDVYKPSAHQVSDYPPDLFFKYNIRHEGSYLGPDLLNRMEEGLITFAARNRLLHP